MISLPKRIPFLQVLYASGFLFTIHIAVLEFINSSFLEQYVPVKSVGLVYIISSLCSVLILTYLNTLLNKFGNFKVITAFLAISIISLFLLGFLTGPTFVILLLFVLHYALNIVIRTNVDVYLEEATPTNDIGSVRGSYLTFSNAAWVIAPLLVALFLGNNHYERMYLRSGFFALFVFGILFYVLKGRKTEPVTPAPFWRSVKALWTNKDLILIYTARFLFNFFIAISVIYMPIYLHQTVGFSWASIGVLLTIMLLPYLLFELPLGRMADRILGEQEILATGFVLMAVAGLLMSLITSPIFLIWAFILFFSRVGTSFVDVMTETYFFKKVNPSDTTALEFFRDTDPLAYIIAPLICSFLLSFVTIRTLFLFSGLLMFIGVYASLRIHDTK